jgi:hypothetical protein
MLSSVRPTSGKAGTILPNASALARWSISARQDLLRSARTFHYLLDAPAVPLSGLQVASSLPTGVIAVVAGAAVVCLSVLTRIGPAGSKPVFIGETRKIQESKPKKQLPARRRFGAQAARSCPFAFCYRALFRSVTRSTRLGRRLDGTESRFVPVIPEPTNTYTTLQVAQVRHRAGFL